jgi:hypothetical protein
MTSLVHDPIFSAISSHQDAAKDVDTRHAGMLAVHPDVPAADHALMQAALMTEITAINGMVATAPMTHIGLQAFASYLAEPRQHHVWNYIDQIGTYDDGKTYITRDASGSEKLIARRAAELG